MSILRLQRETMLTLLSERQLETAVGGEDGPPTPHTVITGTRFTTALETFVSCQAC